MREKNVFLWNFSSLFFQIGLIRLNPMGGVGGYRCLFYLFDVIIIYLNFLIICFLLVVCLYDQFLMGFGNIFGFLIGCLNDFKIILSVLITFLEALKIFQKHFKGFKVFQNELLKDLKVKTR